MKQTNKTKFNHVHILWDIKSISMGYCKKDVTPLLLHWSYIFLALTHRYYSAEKSWMEEGPTGCASSSSTQCGNWVSRMCCRQNTLEYQWEWHLCLYANNRYFAIEENNGKCVIGVKQTRVQKRKECVWVWLLTRKQLGYFFFNVWFYFVMVLL